MFHSHYSLISHLSLLYSSLSFPLIYDISIVLYCLYRNILYCILCFVYTFAKFCISLCCIENVCVQYPTINIILNHNIKKPNKITGTPLRNHHTRSTATWAAISFVFLNSNLKLKPLHSNQEEALRVRTHSWSDL